jgi:hypothetical protein
MLSVGFSLALRSTQYLLEQRNEAQDRETKLPVFIITSQHTKNNFMFHTLCTVTWDMMCVSSQTFRSYNNLIFWVSTFSYICRFLYALYSCIHIEIPDFSLTNLLWIYTDKAEFSFRICKLNFQSNQIHFVSMWNYILWTKDKTFKTRTSNINCHFHWVNTVGRSYLRQNSLMASFIVNLCCKYSLFYSVSHHC